MTHARAKPKTSQGSYLACETIHRSVSCAFVGRWSCFVDSSRCEAQPRHGGRRCGQGRDGLTRLLNSVSTASSADGGDDVASLVVRLKAKWSSMHARSLAAA